MHTLKRPPAEVLEALGISVLETSRLGGGTACPLWRIVTPGGQLVLRTRAEEFSDPTAVRFDHEVLRRLTQSGLPVPRPIELRDGSTWCSFGGKTYEALSWVEGKPFNAENPQTLHHLGGFLALLHQTLSSNPPPGKEGQLREDHPALLRPYISHLRQLAVDSSAQEDIRRVEAHLNYTQENLDGGLYTALPTSLIHGDLHPGNIRFRNSRVSALYDFDYLSLQARSRDLLDAMIFFAASREHPLDSADIWSLTQPFTLDLDRCAKLIRSYQGLQPLEESEWEALPLLLQSRWTQMRLRGSRKVPEARKVTFVTEPFFKVTGWLEQHGERFFQQLRSLSSSSDRG